MVNEAVTSAAQRANPLGLRADPRYRTVAEARIVDQLLVFGWAHECRAGEHYGATAEAAAALDRCVALGLPFEQRSGDVRRFDPAEVLNFIKLAGLNDGDSLWGERFVATGRRLVFEHHGAGAATLPPPAALPPRRFAVSLRREFNLGAWQPGARVRLRVPLPLEDDRLRDLVIVRAPPASAGWELATGPGRLEVRLPVPPERTVALAVEVSFTALASASTVPPTPLVPTDVDLYTRRSDGMAAIGPRVEALAAELAGSCREPPELVRRFWNFLLDRMIFGGVHYDELDPRHPTDSVLESRWYDCHLGSALVVALCRARSIPARIVSGYLLYSRAPTYHYWAEVFLEERGWMPLDSISADLSAMGRDGGWRDYFYGQLDYRMKTECLPRVFTGNPAIRFPRAWYLLTRIDGDGVDVGFYATESGAPIYRDHITVHALPGAIGEGAGAKASVSRTNAGPL